MPSFSCRVCGEPFELPAAVIAKYPGWKPQLCRKHRGAGGGAAAQPPAAAIRSPDAPGPAAPPPLSPAPTSFLAAQHPTMAATILDGDAIYTDGSCEPNPGPGGWGVVVVRDQSVVTTRHGHAPATTNNRMELQAIIEALSLVPPAARVTIHSDSNLAVQTLTAWAAGWERAGWKRKSGPIANLDLVQTAWQELRRRPGVRVQWIKAHVGHQWNELADQLAGRWRAR